MLGKRAQTEDFFADFLPALIIVIIALFVGTALSAGHTSDVERSVDNKSMSFNGMDVLSLMHMPVEGYGNFAHLVASIAEAYENNDAEFFESSDFAVRGSEYAECGEGFESVVGEFFGEFFWEIKIYEVQDVDEDRDSQKMIFSCRQVSWEELDMKYSETYLPASGFTAYRIEMGWESYE